MQIESEIDFISGESLAVAGEGPRGINSRSGTPLLDLHPTPPLFTHCQLLYTVADDFVYFFIIWYFGICGLQWRPFTEQVTKTFRAKRLYCKSAKNGGLGARILRIFTEWPLIAWREFFWNIFQEELELCTPLLSIERPPLTFKKPKLSFNAV